MKNNKPKETWKPIKNFENLYLVSNTGKIFSLIRNKLLKFSYQNTGYLQVTLSNSGKKHYKYVHRLVAENFIVNELNKNSVNHKDGNKHNNNISNLEWVTESENNYHAGINNLKKFGTKHPNSKLTKKDLFNILNLLNEKKLSHKEISKKFFVHRSTISRIAKKQTYSKEFLNE